MKAVLVTSAVAPLLAEPRLDAEQVSQLVIGEGAEVLDERGAYLQLRTVLDDYRGWIHQGYVRRTDAGAMEQWLLQAAWSEGAVLRAAGGDTVRAPHRARLVLEGETRVRLPDGASAEVIAGAIRPYMLVMRDAQTVTPDAWAWREFGGAPYLWGGITAAGIDCSGLVQTTYLARGIPLPRDARDQVRAGRDADGPGRAGDLVFFRGQDTDRVTHVALLTEDDLLVHSTVETGRVTREPWGPTDRAAPLRARVVARRRLL